MNISYKVTKKVYKDPCIVNLLLKEIESQKEVWNNNDCLRSDVEDCTVCEFFSRIHKKIVEELLEPTNDLIREKNAATSRP